MPCRFQLDIGAVDELLSGREHIRIATFETMMGIPVSCCFPGHASTTTATSPNDKSCNQEDKYEASEKDVRPSAEDHLLIFFLLFFF